MKAVISECGRYRYQLERHVSDSAQLGTLLWVMLNPSTADAQQDDPTIRRVIDFTRRFNFRDLIVVNLFAYRATNPRELSKVLDPEGPDNERYVREAWGRSSGVILAWGGRVPTVWKRKRPAVQRMFEGRSLWCLGINESDGSPKHPLFVPKATLAQAWPGQEGAPARGHVGPLP